MHDRNHVREVSLFARFSQPVRPENGFSASVPDSFLVADLLPGNVKIQDETEDVTANMTKRAGELLTQNPAQ
jgi:hypothetical protein